MQTPLNWRGAADVTHKWIMRIGIVALAAMLLSAWVINITALIRHAPWVARNYWNQPIDTYGQLIVLIVLSAFAPILLVKYHRWWL